MAARVVMLYLLIFMRAFDKVDHNLICSKLKAAGVNGCYLKWFVDFLFDRWQYVEYGST